MATVSEYFKNIYSGFKTIAQGMGITASHLVTRSVTLQYPKQKKQLPKGTRNQLFNNIDECIGCSKCAIVCPVDCIDIETLKVNKDENLGETTTGHKKRLWVTKFNIDMAKCCFCGLCTEPCPTECLTMTDKYEYSTDQRSQLIFKFSALNADEVEKIKNTRETPQKNIKKPMESPEKKESDS